TVALREKVKLLEGKLGELIQFGEENDAISEKVHRLSVALVGARDFPALAQSLYFHLREDFAVPHVALRVWGKSVPADFDEAQPVDEAQRRHADALGAPHCGPAAGNPFVAWFRESGEHLRSLALVPLGQTAVFGLLALGSEDPKRFYPEMGTLYLRRIGELCAAGVTARL
ncbi:MAG: 3,5-cyclic-nucleotide phosphodiesterase, partial [Burkholderiales bacterium]|nr:3,5-cyclic-nucleotide phosphodiesterase [Burkholderiales bacterium]